MRKLLRRPRFVLLTLGIVCLLAFGAWECVRIRESVEIRNETSYQIFVEKAELSFPCAEPVVIGPHSTGSFNHNWICGFTVTQLNFYRAEGNIGFCSWDAANEHEPVVVKENSVSCED